MDIICECGSTLPNKTILDWNSWNCYCTDTSHKNCKYVIRYLFDEIYAIVYKINNDSFIKYIFDDKVKILFYKRNVFREHIINIDPPEDKNINNIVKFLEKIKDNLYFY